MDGKRGSKGSINLRKVTCELEIENPYQDSSSDDEDQASNYSKRYNCSSPRSPDSDRDPVSRPISRVCQQSEDCSKDLDRDCISISCSEKSCISNQSHRETQKCEPEQDLVECNDIQIIITYFPNDPNTSICSLEDNAEEAQNTQQEECQESDREEKTEDNPMKLDDCETDEELTKEHLLLKLLNSYESQIKCLSKKIEDSNEQKAKTYEKCLTKCGKCGKNRNTCEIGKKASSQGQNKKPTRCSKCQREFPAENNLSQPDQCGKKSTTCPGKQVQTYEVECPSNELCQVRQSCPLKQTDSSQMDFLPFTIIVCPQCQTDNSNTQGTEKANQEKLDPTPIKQSRVPIIWLLGKPGTGKETQAQNIVTKLPGVLHISTGDLLRKEIKAGSPRGKEIEAIMKEGGLAPTEIVRELLHKKMLAELSNAKAFLIDGYPRNVEQADEFVNNTKLPNVILYLDAPDDVILARLVKRGQTSGRPDDNEDAIKKRLQKANVNDEPILKKYTTQINKIDTNKKPVDIYPQVESVLKKLLMQSGGLV